MSYTPCPNKLVIQCNWDLFQVMCPLNCQYCMYTNLIKTSSTKRLTTIPVILLKFPRQSSTTTNQYFGRVPCFPARRIINTELKKTWSGMEVFWSLTTPPHVTQITLPLEKNRQTAWLTLRQTKADNDLRYWPLQRTPIQTSSHKQ